MDSGSYVYPPTNGDRDPTIAQFVRTAWRRPRGTYLPETAFSEGEWGFPETALTVVVTVALEHGLTTR